MLYFPEFFLKALNNRKKNITRDDKVYLEKAGEILEVLKAEQVFESTTLKRNRVRNRT